MNILDDSRPQRYSKLMITRSMIKWMIGGHVVGGYETLDDDFESSATTSSVSYYSIECLFVVVEKNEGGIRYLAYLSNCSMTTAD
mmetsp:Transcript_13334/g.25028  ORF Transcript_13334/g.25028 Transcript_13334/m.25028 type:complete len:85 (+) Transcript_13334:853-1107(+)